MATDGPEEVFKTKKGEIFTYEQVVESISKNIVDGISYDVILSEYEDEEFVENLIKNVFPNYYAFIQAELDDKFQLLISQQFPSIEALKSHNDEEIRKLLKEFGQADSDFQSFLQDPTGMAFFKETILSHRSIITNNIIIKPTEIIASIQAFLESDQGPIVIEFDVPNRTFDKEIEMLKEKGVISPEGLAVVPSEKTVDAIIESVMKKMNDNMIIIKDQFRQSVSRLREILDDFQPNFLLRLESYLIEKSHGCFKSLPEIFLAFLNDKSPVIKHFKEQYPDISVHGFTPTGTGDNIVARIGDRIIITLKNIQNKGNTVSSLNENIMAYKRRTCKSIIASQIRGMNRAVPIKVDTSSTLLRQAKGALLKFADTIIAAVEKNAKYKPSAKIHPDPSGASAAAEAEEAEEAEAEQEGDLGYFLDLYRGQLLGSTVKNQTPEPLPKRPFPWKHGTKCDMRLEMEHIIGVYEASLLFSDKAYYNAIFTNLQIMSRDSNQGVSKMVFIADKLLFMLPGDPETLNQRLTYLYARLYCMNEDLADYETMKKRYLPYSSYGGAKTDMKQCLLRGIPFRVVTEASFQSILQMATATSKSIQHFKFFSTQLSLFHDMSLRENKDGLQQLFNGLLSILRHPMFSELSTSTKFLTANFDQQINQFFNEGIKSELDNIFVSDCIVIGNALFGICLMLTGNRTLALQLMHTKTFAELKSMIDETASTMEETKKFLINLNIISIQTKFKEYIKIKYTPEKIYRCVLLAYGNTKIDDLLDTFAQVVFTNGIEKFLSDDLHVSDDFLAAAADASDEATERRNLDKVDSYSALAASTPSPTPDPTPSFFSKGAAILYSDVSALHLLPVDEEMDDASQKEIIKGMFLKEHIPTTQLHLFSAENVATIKTVEETIIAKEKSQEEKMKRLKLRELEKINRSIPPKELNKLSSVDFNTAFYIVEKRNQLSDSRKLLFEKETELETLNEVGFELQKKIDADMAKQVSLIPSDVIDLDIANLRVINGKIQILKREIQEIEEMITIFDQRLETAVDYGKTTRSGGGYNSEFVEEDYQLYDKSEIEFNNSPTEELHSYLCSTWHVSGEVKTPFMNRHMQENIYKTVLVLIDKKNNSALCDIYLTHYDRHEEPLIKDILSIIYNYLSANHIYVPLERDERPIYSCDSLLFKCLEKKMNYMKQDDSNEHVFDNVHGNILCIQIFGSPITILMNDLSNGILPIPYGIQTHLYSDPFYPETFFYLFNVLKCILLTVPNCASLSIYFSYLNLLLGESFLHNLYTDSSFSLLERIHSHYFDKIYELQKTKTFTGPSNYTYDSSTDRLMLTIPTESKELPISLKDISLPKNLVTNVPEIPNENVMEDMPNLVELPRQESIGGTRRRRQYKQKTKRYRTLSKRFKKNKTRRLH